MGKNQMGKSGICYVQGHFKVTFFYSEVCGEPLVDFRQGSERLRL